MCFNQREYKTVTDRKRGVRNRSLYSCKIPWNGVKKLLWVSRNRRGRSHGKSEKIRNGSFIFILFLQNSGMMGQEIWALQLLLQGQFIKRCKANLHKSANEHVWLFAACFWKTGTNSRQQIIYCYKENKWWRSWSFTAKTNTKSSNYKHQRGVRLSTLFQRFIP